MEVDSYNYTLEVETQGRLVFEWIDWKQITY